ncbi:MAG: hypothetical protein IB618_03505 [Candidatus Pacearchaeota archaeon]|nr:MAG: hypothetical protein IB618_03505 [Candidatus Pacearchaeota archaeon]
MVVLDLSGMSTFIPVFGFLLVFVVVYALLGKTKVLGDNRFVHILTSFAIAIIFLVSANAVEYVRVVTPWFAAFVVSLLFIVLVVSLIKGDIDKFFKPGFGWLIVIILIAVFVFSAVYVFADIINKYMAGPKAFLLQPTVIGIIVLIGITILASWLLTRK